MILESFVIVFLCLFELYYPLYIPGTYWRKNNTWSLIYIPIFGSKFPHSIFHWIAEILLSENIPNLSSDLSLDFKPLKSFTWIPFTLRDWETLQISSSLNPIHNSLYWRFKLGLCVCWIFPLLILSWKRKREDLYSQFWLVRFFLLP